MHGCSVGVGGGGGGRCGRFPQVLHNSVFALWPQSFLWRELDLI